MAVQTPLQPVVISRHILLVLPLCVMDLKKPVQAKRSLLSRSVQCVEVRNSVLPNLGCLLVAPPHMIECFKFRVPSTLWVSATVSTNRSSLDHSVIVCIWPPLVRSLLCVQKQPSLHQALRAKRLVTRGTSPAAPGGRCACSPFCSVFPDRSAAHHARDKAIGEFVIPTAAHSSHRGKLARQSIRYPLHRGYPSSVSSRCWRDLAWSTTKVKFPRTSSSRPNQKSKAMQESASASAA